MRTIAAAALLLALAACDRQPANEIAAAPDNAAGGYIDKVTTLPEGQVRGVLYRAIIDGGETCQAVAAFAREPDREGKPTWSARCKEGSEWVISIGNDGVAQVTGASVTRR